jgi:hypothetical protein
VRHVRMLGLCLVAMVALGASMASSALAIKEPDTSWSLFNNCPLNSEVEEGGVIYNAKKCVFGATHSGEGGSYTVGGITVPIKNSIVLQGALTKPHEINGIEHMSVDLPPNDGASPIRPVGEPVPQEVLGNVSEAEMNEFGWPEGLRESYKTAQKHGWFKPNKTSEIIEPAGADRDYVSEFWILVEEEPAIIASIQIQGVNKWLESIGGNCFIGSEADPIVQTLTTGESTSPLTGETLKGSAGLLELAKETQVGNLSGVRLVDNRYSVPGAEKCGGAANEAYIDPVVNHAFGLPAPAGASKTELIGQLVTSSALSVSKHHALEK